MFLHALATALPEPAYTQAECWSLIERSAVRTRLTARSLGLLRAVLLNDNGIATRHFALPEIAGVFNLGAGELNEAFRRHAPPLAARALTAALAQAGLQAAELDALLVCTCTGYLCPGLTSYVAEQLGLRANACLQDLVGHGCGAAIPLLRAAHHVLAAEPGVTVACVAVEVCSAAFFLDDDPGVLISACLFGDGAAATIWRGTPGRSGLRCHDFRSLHVPEDRDFLRFENRGGKLRNLLHKSVPARVGAAVSRLMAETAAAPGNRPIRRVLAHPGGRDVLAALAAVLPEHTFAESAAVLRRCGNMSSPSVLFVLEEYLSRQTPPPDGDLWLVSFGAGFSAHGCRLGA